MPLSIPVRTSDEVQKERRSNNTLPETDFRPSALNVSKRLYDHLKRRRREHRPSRVYASQIKDCGRKIAMGLMGFAKGPTGEDHPEWVVVADLGSWLHDRVESWLREIGGLIRSEFSVRSEDGTLSGRVDALLEGPAVREEGFEALIEVQGQQFILDTKTVSDKDFKAGAKGRKIPGYVAQISVYGRLLGVQRGIILLVNRNTGEFKDLEFDIDFDYADSLLGRAAVLVQQANDRQLPEAEEWGDTPAGTYYCRNLCPFYRQCAAQQQDGSIQKALDAGASPEEL